MTIVSKGYENQIRHRLAEDVERDLLKNIPIIANTFVGKEPTPFVVAECIKLAFKKFSYLSVPEITEAYRLYSIGDIAKEEKVYKFDVKHFGTILSAYCQKRKKVLADLLRTSQEEKERDEEKEKRALAMADFERTFPEDLKNAKENYRDWRKIPVFWFKAAWKRGLITLTPDEICHLRADAIELAKAEMIQEGDIFRIESITNTDPTLQAKTRNIAGQLAIFRKFCNNDTITNKIGQQAANLRESNITA